MRHPLLLPGLLIPLGIALYPSLNTQPLPLILAIGACGLLGWIGRSWPAAGAACLLFGMLRASLWIPGPSLHSPGVYAHGQVSRASTHRAILDLRALNGSPALGPLSLKTKEALPVGAQVAVFGPIGPSQSVTLPGSPSPAYAAQLNGQNSVLRVQSWVPLSLGRPRVNGDFEHTENPGLLRALSSGDRAQIPQADQDTLTHTGPATCWPSPACTSDSWLRAPRGSCASWQPPSCSCAPQALGDSCAGSQPWAEWWPHWPSPTAWAAPSRPSGLPTL